MAMVRPEPYDMTVELVGGPHDGYRMKVDVNVNIIKMPRPLGDGVYMTWDIYKPRKQCKNEAWLFDYEPDWIVI